MIKILFVTNQLVCGGVEQALFDLINLIDKDKFDATVLVRFGNGIWEERFRQAGIRVVSVYDCIKKSKSPISKVQNYFKLKRLETARNHNGKGTLEICLPENFDIIVSYSLWSNEDICFHRGAKTIKYVHNDAGTSEEFCTSLTKYIDVQYRFDKVVCVSQDSLRSFEQATGRNNGVVAIHNPINSNLVKENSKEFVEIPGRADVPYICAVGRLAPEKGFDRLVRIHKKLLDAGLPHNLLIIGEGTERKNIEAVIEKTGTFNSVFLLGYKANPYPYIKQSKFLVCSSYSEALSMVAMESLLLEIPVVSSVPVVKELFGDKNCGVITENDDESLYAGMKEMLTNSEYYQVRKLAAEERSKFFDGKHMVKAVEELYMELVE